jgi:maltose O-acetyltransferase
MLDGESNYKQDYNKMLSGKPYYANDPYLVDLRNNAELLYKSYNTTTETDVEKRKDIYSKLFGSVGRNLSIRAPFYCDYGINLYIGDNVYMNFNCVILDCAKVTIGNNTMFAPNVQIYTAAHPIDVEQRIKGVEFAKEIFIGNNVWIGGGAIINPGVTIGDNTVIGSGSVVTKNIPSNCVAVGNPCKVIKKLEENEK